MMEDRNNVCENENHPSQSLEEPPDLLREQLNVPSPRSDNAWSNLKTITTFDPGAFQEMKSQEKERSQSVGVDEEKKFQDSKSSQYDKTNLVLSKEETSKSSIKITRRVSHRNSFSEGSNPYGVEHLPVSSSKRKNGTRSDLGSSHASANQRACAPAQVQSLTRFSPTSLLVESLIDQLCKLMEKDSGKQKKLYHVICERLHQMQLIDETYNIEEFQFMRSHYQKALYQLLAVAKSSTQTCDKRTILLPLPRQGQK
ncbi:Eukaryotic translation initiation factor 2-alpha kinase 2 [Frankliniella fusca]|uniref:non-specific serine/threonine protein kinase n=1 Tax=Frankliniella fusca TaxID=407009 RepID=A0AAE1GU03_9NEOP|nr:Eukaryotic translation initiation factor 2-alpha kinase 2 [Frankliniella fusca]